MEATSAAPERLPPETVPRGSVQRQMMHGWLWTTAGVALLLPVNFLVNAVLARQLGVRGFGEYAYLLTVVSLGQAVLALGYGNGVGRFAAAAHGKGDQEQVVRLLRSHTSVNTAWAGVSTAVLLILALRPGVELATMLVLASFLAAYLESSSLALPAVQRSDGAAKTSMVIVMITQMVVLAACIATRDAALVFALRVVAGACAAPIRLLALPPEIRRACLVPGRPSLPGAVLRYGFTAYAATLLGLLIFSRTEIVLLEAFDHSMAIGLFALAAGLAGQITGPVDAAIGPLTPALTSVVASDPADAARALMRALKAMVTAVMLWSSLTVLPVATVIPLLYGEPFTGAVGVFLITASASFMGSATSPNDAFAYALGRPGLTLRAGVIAFAVGGSLALVLIPPFGLYGAAVASAAGQIVAGVAVLVPVARASGAGWAPVGVVLRAAVHVAGVAVLTAVVVNAPMPVASGALVTVVLVALTWTALRSGRLVHWEAGEAASVIASAPSKVAPLLRRVLPAEVRTSPADFGPGPL